MRRVLGFTLIELMITVTVIGILTAIAYPSYQDYIRRGVRSQGQQFLMDLAQREEQFFLDQKLYTTTTGAGGLNMPVSACTVPCEIQGKYSAPVITLIAGPPAGFRISLTPVAGSIMNPGATTNDGTLIINNLQQRWREVDANNTFNPGPLADCRWEEGSCKPR